MRQRAAIRIRKERDWWHRRDLIEAAVTCPTCHRPIGWSNAPVHIRRGRRFFVRPSFSAARPIRLSWPVKVRQSGDARRRIMGRTWAVCPDPAHDAYRFRNQHTEPAPVVSPEMRRSARQDAPTRHKNKARRHKNHQAKNRR